MVCAIRHILHPARANYHVQLSSPLSVSRPLVVFFTKGDNAFTKRYLCKLGENCGYRNLTSAVKSSPGSNGVVPAEDDEDGVSLGTMKLPLDTDIQRFEILLFQWANSLCQGANLPLPVPLKHSAKNFTLASSWKARLAPTKVDKISGGARLGFITIGDGKTEVLVYIDCLVFPATGGSGPMFRAIRNGPLKDKSPPGEPRIMRSLLQALKMSIEIAKV